MSAARTRRLFTESEYLLVERQAETKSEYLNGEVFALAGASPRHGTILVNILASLHAQLRGGPCRPFVNDLRVRAGAGRLYTYPDVVVVCGEQRFRDEQKDTLTNPTLILEVLSPSTEDYDRGRKSVMYREIESLTVYVMVWQDRVFVESHARQSRNQWLMTETSGLDSELALDAIGCVLRLRDVYEGVEGMP